MKWCRFQAGQQVSYGIVEDDRVIEVAGQSVCGAYGDPYQLSPRPGEALAPRHPADALRRGTQLPRPCRRHGAAAWGRPPLPGQARAEFSLGACAHRHRGKHHRAQRVCAGAVQPEGQLAVVIGKKARNVSKENALDYIFGYSIGNDISQRPWQQADRTMFRGKNCDTFKPFGPWIVTGLDPTQFRIIVRHNGTVWEDFSSADQIWDTATWIQELSRYTTLHPGDVLWMGTQGADGDMVPGDVIEVEISDIGILRNYVVAEE